MHKHRRFHLGLLVISLLVGVTSFSLSNTQTKVSTPAYAWSGTQTSTEGTYFNSVGSETGETLKLKLRSIISVGTSESYDWSRYEAADEAEGQSSKVLLIYSRQIVAKTAHVSGSTGWNREHSFAKSLFNDQAPAVNDNHHIFADDNKTNGARSNKPFNVVDMIPANQVYDGYGNLTENYTTSSYFMPNDLAKGEVARATMYMNTRYGYSITLNFYSVELMLEWHLDHPVTNREVYRNNVVHSLQKNRNPYIDHQDWACKVYGDYNAATQQLCNQQQVEPTQVTVSPSTGSVNMGSTLNLSASVLPSGANQSVTWETSNSAIATVNHGVVTPVSAGQVTIHARSTVNSSIVGSATITVTNTPVAVSGISLDTNSFSLIKGNTRVLIPTITPSNASNKSLTWSSSNATIASVNTSGLVTANAVGSALITATTSDGGYSASATVSVSEPSAETSILGSFYNTTVDNNGGVAVSATNLNNGETTKGSLGFGGVEVVSSATSTNTYYPRSGGIAIGSGSNPGSVTISFDAAYYPSKVEVQFNDAGTTGTYSLSSSSPTTIVDSGSEGVAYSNPSTGTPLIATFSEPAAQIVLSTTSRVALVSIKVFYGMSDTSEEDVTAWANQFLTATDAGCTSKQKADIESVWPTLSASYASLSQSAREIIEDSTPNGEGTAIEEALARYVLIVERHNLTPFINGITIQPLNKTTEVKTSTRIILMQIVTISAVATVSMFVVLSKKRKLM